MKALLCNLPVILFAAAPAVAQDVVLYATQVDLQTAWVNEALAAGAPATAVCTDTANTFASNPVATNTSYLKALAFDAFTLPPGKMITAVKVDVMCRYDDNGHSGAIDVRVDLNGAQLTTLTASFFNNSNITDCRWMVGAIGDVTGSADWVHNPAWVNQIDVWVRRSTTTPQNQTTLRVKALRITVSLTDDSDGDFVPNSSDNCDFVSNPGQQNADNDAFGDVCDSCTDTDGDYFGNPGFPNSGTCPQDNCPTAFNPTQADVDLDGIGDACDACTDTDHDGFRDPGASGQSCAVDNCPWVPNANQADQDGDGLGDVCDPCPTTVSCDCNGNGILDSVDRAQHPDWDRNNDGALDQCFRPIATADAMSEPYPTTAHARLWANDSAVNSPLRPNEVVYDYGSPPRTYPATPDKIIIITGPQHGSLADTVSNPTGPNPLATTEFHPSTGYACGPDAFVYQIVDRLGVPSLPVTVFVNVTPSQSFNDCNANGQNDTTECLNNPSLDCNFDQIPDACQCALDGNNDGIPDSCQVGTTLFCFGHGGIGPCPCGNASSTSAKQGCKNSLGVGASLAVAGTASLAADTVVLTGANMPFGSSCLYFQGMSVPGSGTGVAFGDGLMCIGGTITRLAVLSNPLGTSRLPAVGGTPLSQVGGVLVSGTRFYQVWYRDSAVTFCTPSLFNTTSAVRVIWGQ